MKIELTDREIHTIVLALEHAKSTVTKALQAQQTAWRDDTNYLRYANLETKLKAVKQAA